MSPGTLISPLIAAVVAGAIMVTSLAAQAQAASPHLSPAGWAALATMSDFAFWASTPDDSKPWSVDACDAGSPIVRSV